MFLAIHKISPSQACYQQNISKSTLDIAMKDIYGFPEEEKRKPIDDQNPIRNFKFSIMFEELSKMKINYVESRQRFTDEMIWGEGCGAVKINVMPNALLVFSRWTTDLDGEKLWICKRAYQLNVQEYSGKEVSAASEIFEVIKDLSVETIDRPIREYRNLEYLVKHIANHAIGKSPLYFKYEKIKKLSENCYIISYQVKNVGVGQIGASAREASYSPYAFLNLFLEENGSIRCTIHYIEVEYEGSDWIIGNSFFDQRFLPTQRKEEICEAITTAFKYLA